MRAALDTFLLSFPLDGEDEARVEFLRTSRLWEGTNAPDHQAGVDGDDVGRDEAGGQVR